MLPSACVCACASVRVRVRVLSRSVMSDYLRPHGLMGSLSTEFSLPMEFSRQEY